MGSQPEDLEIGDSSQSAEQAIQVEEQSHFESTCFEDHFLHSPHQALSHLTKLTHIACAESPVPECLTANLRQADLGKVPELTAVGQLVAPTTLTASELTTKKGLLAHVKVECERLSSKLR